MKKYMNIIIILLIAALLHGCTMDTSSKKTDKAKSSKSNAPVTEMTKKASEGATMTQGKECLLMVNIDYEENLILAKYSIDVFLDGTNIATIQNGRNYFGSFHVYTGQHELYFEDAADTDIYKAYPFNIDDSCTAYCSLKSHLDSIEITQKNITGDAICPQDKHQWAPATCKVPKTCTVCGATEGALADHVPGTWQVVKEATCQEKGEESTKCTVCGEELKRPIDKLPHEVPEWKTVKKATCTEEGEEKGVCSVCGAEVTRAISKIPHTPKDWVIEKKATYSEPGVRVKKCKICGDVVETESYSLTSEEKVKWLKNNCKGGLYSKIARDPDQYKGEYVKFSGKVVQICSEARSADDVSTYRIATKSGYDNVILASVDTFGKSRILEDDKITVYGISDGLYTYTTVLGSTVTIPMVYVIIYE